MHRHKATVTAIRVQDMEAAQQRRGADSLVSISGRITIDSSPELRLLLLQVLETAECEGLTVDLYEVGYVDTSGLAIMLEVLRAARGLKKTFHLSGLRDRPRYLLEATRLLHLFDEVARDVEQ
ncbi:MAG: STAS domain-containing protein [Bryobacteraceae bacterium]